jgi:hypothetical protein
MGTRHPPLNPLSGRLGLRVSSVKLKTLNAFYGHFRSFAHPKPYIKNDQRKKIYNPALIVFRYQKTCLGREEPNPVLKTVNLAISRHRAGGKQKFSRRVSARNPCKFP